jgi:benzylsuccinate CoA-transferase BbsF subunit
LERRAELDAAVASWTERCKGEDVEDRLQSLGVPAHRVAYAGDVVGDPQLAHRDHFVQVPHPTHGKTWVERSAIQLSRTPGTPRWAGPTFGQHLSEVVTEILGYDDERISELITAGALE